MLMLLNRTRSEIDVFKWDEHMLIRANHSLRMKIQATLQYLIGVSNNSHYYRVIQQPNGELKQIPYNSSHFFGTNYRTKWWI